MLLKKSFFLTLLLAGCLIFVGSCKKKSPDSVTPDTITVVKSTAKPVGEAKIAPTIALTLAGEIPSKFGPGPDDYFWNIGDLCFDPDGNLFVADRGWGKVVKLDGQGRFLKSFGNKGQGPGEFDADMASPMELIVGNDGLLYVSAGNFSPRISRFDREGKFFDILESHPGDRPAVNSKGEIFLVSEGPELISVYRFGESNPQRRFFPENLHYDGPLFKFVSNSRRRVDSYDMPILKTNDDRLVVVSNVSLRAFVFGADDREINRFDIGDEALRAALVKRFEDERKRSPNAGIISFKAVLSLDQLLYFFTYSTIRKAFDAYVYSLEGDWKATLQIPAGVHMPFAISKRGEIWALKDDSTIFRFKPPFAPETKGP